MWGKRITTKFYLNTNLKPIARTAGLSYPLYVRVICKQQVSQFKYFGKDLEPRLYTQAEFQQIFIDQNPTSETEASVLEKLSFQSFTTDVEYILTFLHAFDRDDFSIKQLPAIVKSYYDLEKVVIRIASKGLIKAMMKKGFGDLVPIIDWSFHPVAIQTALDGVCNEFDLPKVKIQHLVFSRASDVLTFVRVFDFQSKNKNLKEEKQLKMALDHMSKSDKEPYGNLIPEVLTRAIEFEKTAFKLTKG